MGKTSKKAWKNEFIILERKHEELKKKYNELKSPSATQKEEVPKTKEPKVLNKTQNDDKAEDEVPNSSAPSAKSSNLELESDSKKEKEEGEEKPEQNKCGECGALFEGNICSCGVDWTEELKDE